MHLNGAFSEGCMHKFLLVICYSELTTNLESTQSFSYPELPTPLMWFSLPGMIPLRFSLFLLISTDINLLSLSSKASSIFDPQGRSKCWLLLTVCSTLLLFCFTQHILSGFMNIWTHYLLTVLSTPWRQSSYRILGYSFRTKQRALNNPQ